MIAPVTNLILKDFGSTDSAVGSFVVSIYILGYALGPLVIAPLSEIYGRLPVYHVNNVLFVIWSLVSGFAPNVGALLAFRLLAGLAGSCPVTIGNGSIADCVRKEKRGKVTAIFSEMAQSSTFSRCMLMICFSCRTTSGAGHWSYCWWSAGRVCWLVLDLLGDGDSGE